MKITTVSNQTKKNNKKSILFHKISHSTGEVWDIHAAQSEQANKEKCVRRQTVGGSKNR